MPIIPIPNYRAVYEDFFQSIKERLDIKDCFSIFFGGFLLTQSDSKEMQKKHPNSQLWKMLSHNDNKLMRIDLEDRKQIYTLIQQHFPQAQISMDVM